MSFQPHIYLVMVWKGTYILQTQNNLFRPFGFITPKTLNYLAF
jgi:hypothetical protein